MKFVPDDDDDTLPSWRQRPKPVGFEIAYRLDGDELVIDSTRKVDRVKLGAIEQVRFTFDPGNISGRGYKVRLTLTDGKRITFGNLSWRSMVDVERDDPRYRAFLEKLCPAIAAANPKCVFVAGKPTALWLAFTTITAVSLLGMAAFALFAFSQSRYPAMWISLGLLAATIWQMEPLVRLNAPKALATGEVPAWLVP